MELVVYTPDLKQEWDLFVRQAKNTHFMFFRDYMDYHSDRFQDHSLMFYDRKSLIAVMPANIKEGVLYSHQGLTFGGLITASYTKTLDVLTIFEQLCLYLRELNVSRLVYKCIPHIYSQIPAEEDKYALFMHEAVLIRRDISTAIYMQHPLKYAELRCRAIKKARKKGLRIVEQQDFSAFWSLLTSVLFDNHQTTPVHSLPEITSLAHHFPTCIRLFVAIDEENKVLAGVVVYITEDVVHLQYMASGTEGRESGALDYIIDYLMTVVFKDKQVFDFGISNEQNGKHLNSGLIAQKEGFGARGIVHDFYKIQLA